MKISIPFIVVIVGVVLLVLAPVLTLVPVASQGSQTVTETVPYGANVSAVSITGFVYGSFSWTATSSVQFYLVTCPSLLPDGGCNGSPQYHNQTGSSGSGTFTVQTGGFIAAIILGSAGSTATLKISLSLPTVGFILIIVGLIVLIVGLMLRKRKKEKEAGAGWVDGSTFTETHVSPAPKPKQEARRALAR